MFGIPTPTELEIKLAVGAVAIAAASFAAYHLKGKIDEGTLADEKLACAAQITSTSNKWQAAADATRLATDAAVAAGHAQQAVIQGKYDDAVKTHAAAEAALAASTAALARRNAQQLRDLADLSARVKAGAGSCTVSGPTGTDTWDSARIAAALDWIGRLESLAGDLAVREQACHDAAVEAAQAWPTNAPAAK
jgi:HAMP domain-containing protein